MNAELHARILADLVVAGKASPYHQDANESDPRYLSYGVRAPQVKAILKRHVKDIRSLTYPNQLALAERLISSGYGEQQSIALGILEGHGDTLSKDSLDFVIWIFRHLHGWSKVDAYTGRLLQNILTKNPENVLPMLCDWSEDESLWIRRASIAVFTRRLAKSGFEIDFALEQCSRLKFDPERLVLNAVGWALKDYLVSDPTTVLSVVNEWKRQGVSNIIPRYVARGLQPQDRAQLLLGSEPLKRHAPR